MKLHGGAVAGLLILAAIQGFAVNQTQSGSTEEDGARKREEKKQIPTFVGSDGVVRKVSPSAILEEMKRCLPPGIPIPMDAVWPDLPPNLGETPEDVGNERRKPGLDAMPTNGVPDEQNLQEEKKRVMRSNAAVPSSDGLNIKLDLPTSESVIFSPTGSNQRTFSDVLKEMFSKFGKNSTGFEMKFVDEGAVVDRFKKKFKAPNDDYQDYDYDEPNKEEGRNQINSPKYPTRIAKSRHGKRRDPDKNRDVHPKMSSRKIRRRKVHGIPPDYDFDYNGPSEDRTSENESKEFQPLKRQNDLVPRDELQRQIELNEYLGALTQRLQDVEDQKRHKTSKDLAKKEVAGHVEDYNKVLATVIELNSSLVRLLERAIFSAICHRGSKSEEPERTRNEDKIEEEENNASSFLLECMEKLMQEKKTLRGKRDDNSAKDRGIYRSDPLNELEQLESGKMKKIRSSTKQKIKSVKQTDLNLLKWLLKWYLIVST